jgi:N-methylhydantoinase A
MAATGNGSQQDTQARAVRLAVDTGGTFTDLVVEDTEGVLSVFKSSTTPSDPVQGVLDVIEHAAEERNSTATELLGGAELFIYGTTHAINAVLTGRTAKTALLVTEGHRDVLLLREGGRIEAFDTTRAYPDPYIPRDLTFGVPERVDAEGRVVAELDTERVVEICAELREKQVEAVAVCLLWSLVNDAHEARIAELLEEHLPGVPYTLSSRLNPILREYRRASSTAIDASLKPLMAGHLGHLRERLEAAGFAGRLLVISSNGGALDASEIAAAPVHSLNSGPAMAPIAGRYYARRDRSTSTAIVADTGGTSYDVSLIRKGQIPRTTETWLGEPWFGHMTGFPSIDVKSIGAGGGSIASVDTGGLLTVGPASAGADPGPVCYGRGGTEPTLTDACVALGYIDPDYFAGGRIRLDIEAARGAVDRAVAQKLGLGIDEAAQAIVDVATQNMVGIIEEITINQGVDPRGALLVGGGGAAGLNSVAIARRLGCETLLIPETGATLSAAGALLSDLSADFAGAIVTSSKEFDYEGVNAMLTALEKDAATFATGPGAAAVGVRYEYFAEARYENQSWDLEFPLPQSRIESEDGLAQVVDSFGRLHQEVFAIAEPETPVRITRLRLRVNCQLREGPPRVAVDTVAGGGRTRSVHFQATGRVDAPVVHLGDLSEDAPVEGPAIVESPITTIVIDPGATATRTSGGGLSIDVGQSI